MSKADIGLIGLAVMGENLVLNMTSHDFTVAVYNRTQERAQAWLERYRAAGAEVRSAPTPADAARIKQALKETPGVKEVKLITPKQAKQRLLHHLTVDATDVADARMGDRREIGRLGQPPGADAGLDRDDLTGGEIELPQVEGHLTGGQPVRVVDLHRGQRRELHGDRHLAGRI